MLYDNLNFRDLIGRGDACVNHVIYSENFVTLIESLMLNFVISEFSK